MNFETNFNGTNETEKWKNQFTLEQKLTDLEGLIKGEEEKNEKMDDFSHKGNDRYYELVDEYNKIKEEIGESQPLTKKQKLIALDKLINERMEEIDRKGIDLNYDGDEVYYGLVDKYNKLMGEVGVEESNEIPVPQPVVEEVKSEEEFNEGVEEESQEIPVPQPVIEEFKPEVRSAILKKSISALLEKLINERLKEMEGEGNRTIDPELSAWIDEYDELAQSKKEVKLEESEDRSAILEKLINERLKEMEGEGNRTIDPELSAWIDEYDELAQSKKEVKLEESEDRSAILEKLINERLKEMEGEGNRTIDPELSAWIDEYKELMEEVSKEEESQEIPVSDSVVKEAKPEEEFNEKSATTKGASQEIPVPQPIAEEVNAEEASQEIPVSDSVVKEVKPEEESNEELNTKKVINTLDEMDKETSVEVAELSPEKGSLFNRLKESFKNKENQKKALIFATALAVGTAVPYASMVYFGGGFFGIGAGASIPILKMVGIASKSAYLGGPLGGALIGLATKKILDFGFAKAENNGREMSEDEMKTLIKNVDEAMKQVNVEDLNKTWKNS